MTKQILHYTFTLRITEYKIYPNFEMFLNSSARVVMLQCIMKYILHQTDKVVGCFIALKYMYSTANCTLNRATNYRK